MRPFTVTIADLAGVDVVRKYEPVEINKQDVAPAFILPAPDSELGLEKLRELADLDAITEQRALAARQEASIQVGKLKLHSANS